MNKKLTFTWPRFLCAFAATTAAMSFWEISPLQLFQVLLLPFLLRVLLSRICWSWKLYLSEVCDDLLGYFSFATFHRPSAPILIAPLVIFLLGNQTWKLYFRSENDLNVVFSSGVDKFFTDICKININTNKVKTYTVRKHISMCWQHFQQQLQTILIKMFPKCIFRSQVSGADIDQKTEANGCCGGKSSRIDTLFCLFHESGSDMWRF